MITLFLNNLFVLFCVLSPLFSFFIVQLHFLNDWRWFTFCVVSLLLLSLFILFGYAGIDAHTLPSMLMFYPLSVLCFILVLTIRFGIMKFAKILSLSLMLGFILTELHELPVFFFSIFGIYGGDTYLVWYLPQIYLLIVSYLTVKLGGLKWSWKPIVLFIVCLVSLFSFYFFDPKIDTYAIPPLLSYLKRVLCFAVLSFIFYFWGDLNG